MALLMNKNFELRRRIFGDAALGKTNLAMIKCAWSVNGESLTHCAESFAKELPIVSLIPCHSSFACSL